LVGFTAIYSLLAAIDFGLMAKFARFGADETDEHDVEDDAHEHESGGADRVPALIY
jgi:hypothetical protein